MSLGLWLILGLLASVMTFGHAQTCMSMRSVILTDKSSYPAGCQQYLSNFCSFIIVNYSGFNRTWLERYAADSCPYVADGRQHDYGAICEYYFGCSSSFDCQAPLGVPKLPVQKAKLCYSSCTRYGSFLWHVLFPFPRPEARDYPRCFDCESSITCLRKLVSSNHANLAVQPHRLRLRLGLHFPLFGSNPPCFYVQLTHIIIAVAPAIALLAPPEPTLWWAILRHAWSLTVRILF